MTVSASRTMTLIHYASEIVATVSTSRVHFTGPLDGRPDNDPLKRFVLAMGRYAADVLEGRVAGPYDQDDAERYARAYWIDADELQRHQADDDQQLATRFGVPVEQIALARSDLDTSP